MLREQKENAFTEYWREIQQKYIEELESVFGRIPVTKIRWYETEIRGIQALERLREDMPAYEELFAQIPPVGGDVYEPEEGGWRLKIYLPGTEKAEVSRYGTDLDIAAGNCVRRIPLPQTLLTFEIREVTREKDSLEILFLPAEQTEAEMKKENAGEGSRK